VLQRPQRQTCKYVLIALSPSRWPSESLICLSPFMSKQHQRQRVWCSRATNALTLMLFDMNGLKQINDSLGHLEGDRAINTYLQSVVAVAGAHGDTYRGDASDEVYVILRSMVGPAGLSLARQTLLVSKRTSRLSGILTAACGLLTTEDHTPPRWNSGASGFRNVRGKDRCQSEHPQRARSSVKLEHSDVEVL